VSNTPGKLDGSNSSKTSNGSLTETLTWIPVWERLPEAETDVLVWVGDRVCIAERGRADTGWFVAFDSSLREDVVYWAEMPRGPR
jgi:hypothetical protein